MKISRLALAATTAALLAPAAGAAQDAAAGEKAFRQCQSCHVVQAPDGTVLAGRNAKTGPNLYGVIGRQAGVVDGFRYGDALVAAGEAGLVWDTDNMQAYLTDPTSFLRETLDDSSARSKMSYRLRRGADDMAAFLATFSE